MEQPKPDMDKLIKRIKHLLTITTDRGASETEAETAARQAHALLAKYNLSLVDMVDDKPEGKVFVVDEEIETDPYVWRLWLANACAKLYFCKNFYKPRGTRSSKRHVHCFVGERHNIEVVKLMFVYLTTAVDRLAREGALKMPPDERSPYRTAFRQACAYRLYNRIHKMIEDAKKGLAKDETGRNLPALLNMYEQSEKEVSEFMQQNIPLKGVFRKRNQFVHAAGTNDGLAAGDKIGLNPQVSGCDRQQSTTRIGQPTHLLGNNK